MTEQKELNKETETQTLAEAVAEYEPKTIGLISDLDYFDITEPIVTKVGKKDTPDEFTYKALVRDNKEYRVPWSVLKDIKSINEARVEKGQKPIKTFVVLKTGTTRENTKYITNQHVMDA